MTPPKLEEIATSFNYGEPPGVERFSSQKTLYDYQRSALENAAHLLQHLSDQNYKRIFSLLLVITAVWLFASSFTNSKG